MRYCDTIAEYKAAKANGTVTDDTLVIVLEDKQLRFKGQTFDCSGADLSALATKDELTNLIDELIKDEEVIAAAFLDLKAKIEEKPSVEIEVDAELSSDSENPIQNKAVTNALAGKADALALENKVDKVDGKQLSTEDFTTALKAKLEGLNNYDDTSIQNSVNSLTTQINTLVSGNASVAIESFNEIIAFLNGVEDSESLDSIIASIEQQIANKQDILVSGTSIKTINGESILGEGNIVVNVDTSNLATKEEVTNLQNEVIANEEVTAAAFNEINDRINAISENVSGTTVTKEEFESTVTTINESIETKADATSTSESISSLEESVNEINTSLANYATTESLANEVEAINNAILENEEITAAALNDLQSKIEDIYSKLNALGA